MTVEGYFWSILAWLNIINSTQVRIVTVRKTKTELSCLLENDACDFSYGFDLNDIKELRAVNDILRFWVNNELTTIQVTDTETLFDLDFSKAKDLKKLDI